ncbi:PD-(D/E)XK nuclease family protein [uncultured Leptotrichia sp.]|uniref:PD-(D/E)XK nuclease family protein n=1 Tax=uncultured Leptotrichia sp. TaxID=159271 RepID=UPI002616F4C9|nr:PD-(D/E)XK nuclease family protein [uncultured Leptotrichia sp.]
MKISYKGIGSDLKNILFKEFEKNENTLFVFENSASFFEIKREFLQNEEMQQKLGIFQNFKMMNSYDFYENVFVTDKIVVKEEKQVVMFYNALTEKLKKDMKVNNYYDIIDVAYNYYNLFAELQEYKIDLEKIELEKWQVETFRTLVEIDNEMKKVVQQKGLILPYMLRNVENISDNFLNKFSKICFVNKVKITPFEKELIGKIENRGIAVENILQLSENDFNEEKLKIKDSFSLPEKNEFLEKFGTNIEIFEYENKFSQVLGLVKKLDESENDEKIENRVNYKIYDLQDNGEDGKKDYQLLRQEKISSNLELTMKKTKIYKILELICNILENVKIVEKKLEDNEKFENIEKKDEKDFGNDLRIRMKDLYSGFKSDDFLRIFGLKKSYDFFMEFVEQDYRYMSKNEIFRILENQNGKFSRNLKDVEAAGIINFIDEIEKIFEYQTLGEYENYLEKIFERSGEMDKNVRDKYFEALSEMVVLEDFSFDNLWKGFFNENGISASLLKLFLKYLDKKAISLNLEETDEQDSENVSRYSINSFSAISETQKENLIFLNIQDIFPKININNYLFTKIQRAKMGLPVSDDEKQIEIFKFYQNILGSKNIYLSYVKNLDENIDSAGVVEEIKLKYAIEAQKNKIDENDELNFIKKYFLENVEKSWESREIGKFIPSKLKKDLNKIKAEKVSLGYYSFEEMQNFEYGYYLKKMIGNTEVEKIEDKVDNLMFGNIIHGLYEKIVMENKEVLEKGEFVINNEEIRKTLKSILNSFEYKIPKEYLEFYKKVSFEEIVKSVEKILTKLMKTLENEEEIEIYSEERIKLKSEKEIYENIFINGMIDLHIKLKNKEILYDYKSGILKNKKGEEKKEKVVNAFKQLDYYSVMLPEKNVQEIERFVVDVWDGDIIGDTREKEEEFLSEKNIREVVKKYYETDYYDVGDVKDVQNYTYQTFKDVCRREDELNDENK